MSSQNQSLLATARLIAAQSAALMLLYLIWPPLTHAGVMEQRICISEPVFNNEVCSYSNRRNDLDPLILIHGLGEDAHLDWQNQLEMLEQQHNLIVIKLPGITERGRSKTAYSPENYARLINVVADFYRIGQFDLAGHSLGGAIALWYAAHFPERLDRLILVDVAGVLHRVALSNFWVKAQLHKYAAPVAYGKSGAYLENLAGKLIHNAEEMTGAAYDRLKKLVLPAVNSRLSTVSAAVNLIETDYSGVPQMVSAPTLIVWGEGDTVAPLRTGRVLERWIKKSQLVVLPNIGHVPMRSASSHFNRIVQEFLQEGRVTTTEIEGTATDNHPPSRLAECHGESDITIEGSYDRVVVSDCRNVTLRNLTAREVEIANSNALIEDVSIQSDSSHALLLLNSRVILTNSRLTGDVAIHISGSSLDAAGSEITGRDFAFQVEPVSQLLCSVCKIISGGEEYWLSTNEGYRSAALK